MSRTISYGRKEIKNVAEFFELYRDSQKPIAGQELS
jgi:hypothetical protein